MMSFRLFMPIATMLLLCAPAASANVLNPGTYVLNNHPNGGLASPLYGLRLTELINITPNSDRFTFDFDHDLSDMRLYYDGTSYHIYGTSYGGLDAGADYDPNYSGVWSIDFTYGPSLPKQTGSTTFPRNDDVYVPAARTGPVGYNTGTIQQITDSGGNQFVGSLVNLVDYSRDFEHAFSLSDDDDSGHRRHVGRASGWGWLNNSGIPHIGAPDWLFTVHQVPLPGGIALAMVGMLCAGVMRRRIG